MRGEKDKNYWLKVFPCREVRQPRAGTSLWFGVEVEIKMGSLGWKRGNEQEMIPHLVQSVLSIINIIYSVC